MARSYLFLGIISGLLSGVAGYIYLQLYQNLFFLDFSLIINFTAIMSASIIACILMAVAYFYLEKNDKSKFKGILNLLIIATTFISIVPIMLMSLPLEVEFPEMFPGLAIPMHFFPAIMFFGILPFFNKKTVL